MEDVDLGNMRQLFMNSNLSSFNRQNQSNNIKENSLILTRFVEEYPIDINSTTIHKMIPLKVIIRFLS